MAFHDYTVDYRDAPGGSAAPAHTEAPKAAFAPKAQPKAPVAQDDDDEGLPF